MVVVIVDVEVLRVSVSFVVLVVGFESRDLNFFVFMMLLVVKLLYVYGDKDSLVICECV